MLHKITDGDKFVSYASDEINDQINKEVLKLMGSYDPSKKLSKPIYTNLNEKRLSNSRKASKSYKRK